MAVNEVGRPLPSPAKQVGTTPLVDLFVRAFLRCGLNAQQAAAALGMAPADFSKAFSVNWPERNPVMKKWDGLDMAIRRELAVLLAADFALTAPDSEQTRVIRDFARLIKESA